MNDTQLFRFGGWFRRFGFDICDMPCVFGSLTNSVTKLTECF